MLLLGDRCQGELEACRQGSYPALFVRHSRESVALENQRQVFRLKVPTVNVPLFGTKKRRAEVR